MIVKSLLTTKMFISQVQEGLRCTTVIKLHHLIHVHKLIIKSLMYNDTSMYYVGQSFEAVCNLKQNLKNILSLDESELVC